MAQIIEFAAHGGPEVLRPIEREVGEPGPGEVRLRQTAVGVNYLDVYVRRGDFGAANGPGQTGFEAAGVVEAAGPEVTEVAVGDRVAYQLVKDAYASARVMPAARLVRLPDDITDETAAAIMLKGMTAEYLLRRFRRVKAGDTILVHAASGGVGTILTQWARHLGATVIGTAGTEEKADRVRANGAHHAVV